MPFFSKASIIAALEAMLPKSKVMVDCTNCKSISYDVQEFIHDYPLHAQLKQIAFKNINFKLPESIVGH